MAPKRAASVTAKERWIITYSRRHKMAVPALWVPITCHVEIHHDEPFDLWEWFQARKADENKLFKDHFLIFAIKL